MSTVPWRPRWRPADVDAAWWWAECGGQWLTGGPPRAPVGLVRDAVGMVRHLDALGAGLAESFTAGGLGLLGEHAALLGLGPSSAASCGGATRLLRAADGWVCAALSRADDLDLLPAWLDITGSPADPWPAVTAAVARREAATVVERGAELGLACALPGEAGGRAEAVLVERLGDAPPRALAGALVVNLGALWAGPLCGDLLARLGARVVTVESPRRPDGARATPSFFAAVHERHELAAVELASPAFARLLQTADVVIEGSRPRALAQLGIDAPALVAGGGPRVWVSLTGHGRAVPFAMRVAFGDDAAVAGGLIAGSVDAPVFLADAVADPLTALVAACTVTELVAAGGRWLADVALSRVAASVAGEWVAAAASPAPPRPRRSAAAAPPAPLGRDTTRVLADLGAGA